MSIDGRVAESAAQYFCNNSMRQGKKVQKAYPGRKTANKIVFEVIVF
jgi:hypothetical protein